MLRTISSRIDLRRIAGNRIFALEKQLQHFLTKNSQFAGILPKQWSVGLRVNTGGFQDVLIRWEREGLRIEIHPEYARWLHYSRDQQLFTVMIWMMLAGPEAEYITFNLSDGEAASVARFSFSAFDPRVITLPDQYFFSKEGFAAAKEIGVRTLRWTDRSDEIVWRGAAVGTGVFNPDPVLAQHPSVTQRIRLAHLARGTEVDFAFVPNDTTTQIWHTLHRADLTRQPIPEATWAERKYAIDVDGYTNTWSNLFIRLAFGCCVFKVESQFGYRQWYYDKLKPWEHYIPVKADLSDLFDQIEWAKSHQKEAANIAARGRALVQTMTFESESKIAAQRILQHWDGRDFDETD